MKRNCPNCQKLKIKHDYQDTKNGEFNREFNVIPKKDNKELRCTVCGYSIVETNKKEVEKQEEK